jgi:putative transposase
MDIRETELDFESMKEKALRQLRSGESLYGKDGAFAPLLKKFLEAALEAEMDGHLDEPERLCGNRRNGKQRKQLRTSDGSHQSFPITNAGNPMGFSTCSKT